MVCRRDLIAMLGGAAAAWPAAVRAQQKAMPVIGYLNPSQPSTTLDDFRRGLGEQGFREDENVAIEYRWGEGRYDRLPGLAAELVHRPVDVIVATGGTLSGRAARAATSTIPIVVLGGGDPVAAGLTDSISHPSGNVTGVAQLVVATNAKRLQLLHELVPVANTITYLQNPTLPNVERETQDLQDAARVLGVRLSVIRAASEGDIAAAFATIARQQGRALLVGADPFFFMQRNQLVSLCEKHRIPAMYFFREFVAAGGLISYGTRLVDAYRQVGIYTGRVLKGAKPADLPIIQQSEKIELLVNLKTAKALGLTVPQSILARADEVIE